ncbi:MAG TPA: YhdH/YhfP family quinone oxidoreductase [Balneolaceae bacterium]|nr:YhdH/YhfP family quinone oxidoreductase [Balneolaceae bacterium]
MIDVKKQYHALVTEKIDGHFVNRIKQLQLNSLPENEVLIRVQYSSLNYKDALSASGQPGITKNYPHTPGIDAAGIVVSSQNPQFYEGDEVIVTSYDLGMNTPGGFAEYIRVPAEWIVPLPQGLTLRESMIYGTAGLTAAIGVKKITESDIKPADGDLLVTGATGGVGSCAVLLLSHLKYKVTAVTGKKKKHDYLEKLGATAIIDRDEVRDESEKPLLGSRWIASVETVGGEILDTVIRQTAHNGVVTCCGNILGHELHTSVYPFILRGVSLMGIDSGICLMSLRKKIWTLLANEWKPSGLEMLAREIPLHRLPKEIDKMLEGKQSGRVIVNLKL